MCFLCSQTCPLIWLLMSPAVGSNLILLPNHEQTSVLIYQSFEILSYIVLRTFRGGVYQQMYEQFPEFIEHEVKLFWICFCHYLNVFYSGTESWSTGWFNKPWFHDSSLAYPSSVIYFAGMFTVRLQLSLSVHNYCC